MKKIIPLLIILLVLSSCASFSGMEKRVKQLELGMSKQDALNIMGKNYFIESASQTPQGKLEVLHFRSSTSRDYLLYFTNDRLSEFHLYVSPVQDIRIIKEESE